MIISKNIFSTLPAKQKVKKKKKLYIFDSTFIAFLSGSKQVLH